MSYDYMYLKYGAYTFTAPVQIQFSPGETIRDQKGRAYLRAHTLTAQSRLYCASESAFNTAIAALIAAHAEDGHDLILRWPDGTETDLDVDSSDMLSGVRVAVKPHAPALTDIEYAPGAYWPFTVKYIWVEELITSADWNVVEFNESFSIENAEDKPRRTVDEVIEGEGEAYDLCENPVCLAAQSGTVVGWFEFPDVPAPLWPDAQAAPVSITAKRGPLERYGDTGRRYEVAYAYRFESPTPLEAVESEWPE